MNKGVFFILGAAILWGTTGTTQVFAPEGASPLTVGAFRLLIGGLGLVLVALFTNSFKGSGKWNLTHVLLGAIAVAVYQVSFFKGVKLTGVAVGTIVAISSSPVSAGILAFLILKEKLSKKWFFATFMAVIGCTFLVLSGSDEVKIDILGILYALGAGLSYALYTLYGKLLLQEHKGNAVVAVMFFGGALILTPLLFMYDISWVMTTKGVITMTHLGLFATTLAYIFFAKGLHTLPVSTTATLSLAEPLTAAILGVVILGEKLNTMVGAGILCLFIGITVLSVQRKKSPVNAE